MAMVWPAFVARRKRVTRRQWTSDYAESIRAAERMQVWDRSPRFGGQKIGELQVIIAPYRQPIAEMPDQDYEAEGLYFLDDHPGLVPAHYQIDFRRWRRSGGVYWVVPFEITSVERSAMIRLNALIDATRA